MIELWVKEKKTGGSPRKLSLVVRLSRVGRGSQRAATTGNQHSPQPRMQELVQNEWKRERTREQKRESNERIKKTHRLVTEHEPNNVTARSKEEKAGIAF